MFVSLTVRLFVGSCARLSLLHGVPSRFLLALFSSLPCLPFDLYSFVLAEYTDYETTRGLGLVMFAVHNCPHQNLHSLRGLIRRRLFLSQTFKAQCILGPLSLFGRHSIPPSHSIKS
jgi:hypothetical protein